MQQKMAFFVMPPKSNNSAQLQDTKSSWIPIVKEGNLLIIPRKAKIFCYGTYRKSFQFSDFREMKTHELHNRKL